MPQGRAKASPDSELGLQTPSVTSQWDAMESTEAERNLDASRGT